MDTDAGCGNTMDARTSDCDRAPGTSSSRPPSPRRPSSQCSSETPNDVQRLRGKDTPLAGLSGGFAAFTPASETNTNASCCDLPRTPGNASRSLEQAGHCDLESPFPETSAVGDCANEHACQLDLGASNAEVTKGCSESADEVEQTEVLVGDLSREFDRVMFDTDLESLFPQTSTAADCANEPACQLDLGASNDEA